jgi:hypothetical protein
MGFHTTCIVVRFLRLNGILIPRYRISLKFQIEFILKAKVVIDGVSHIVFNILPRDLVFLTVILMLRLLNAYFLKEDLRCIPIRLFRWSTVSLGNKVLVRSNEKGLG